MPGETRPEENKRDAFLTWCSLQQDRLRTAWPLVRDHVHNTFWGGGGGGGGGGEATASLRRQVAIKYSSCR